MIQVNQSIWITKNGFIPRTRLVLWLKYFKCSHELKFDTLIKINLLGLSKLNFLIKYHIFSCFVYYKIIFWRSIPVQIFKIDNFSLRFYSKSFNLMMNLCSNRQHVCCVFFLFCLNSGTGRGRLAQWQSVCFVNSFTRGPRFQSRRGLFFSVPN